MVKFGRFERVIPVFSGDAISPFPETAGFSPIDRFEDLTFDQQLTEIARNLYVDPSNSDIPTDGPEIETPERGY